MEKYLLIVLIVLVAILCIAVSLLAMKVNKSIATPVPSKAAAVTENIAQSSSAPAHIQAAIIAAITLYYSEQSGGAVKTDFIVKRIKRLS